MRDTADATPVAAEAYRAAMARLVSAVHLVTTDGPGGRAGFTASAVCSVSDTPPTLLVCLNRASSAYPAFARNDRLCVNTLAADQQGVAAAFGGRTPMGARFAAAAWRPDAAGVPVLDRALAAFSCRIVRRVSAGTHDVLFCEVAGLADPGGGDALVYADRRYHALARAAEPALAQPESGAPGTAEARRAGRNEGAPARLGASPRRPALTRA
ncbi:flavin reductase [Methylobacterium planeticum]|uniref:FMN reductase (NADH) RutF n=1 Tax=Methylobacterium planeticum TaxID=2615211 RepID=A0A6N6MQP4_9HYPH|nr:flavin reductase [Methylobacterium planeticum]KAB1072410.1 FMN reductase [Methylobacterium planeticum]